MAKITDAEVKKLAKLARIQLNEEEVKRFGAEFNAILSYVEKLQAVDTKDIEPTAQVTGLVDVWRQDEVKSSGLNREQLLANAPQTKDGYIKVKRVL